MKIGCGWILLALFLVLKLVGGIHWSWLWVMSPLWIGLITHLVISILENFFDDEDILRVKR